MCQGWNEQIRRFLEPVQEPRRRGDEKQLAALLSHILGSHPDIIGSSDTYVLYRNSVDLIRLRYRAHWYNELKYAHTYIL
jgi:hypothetical protein